MVALMMGSRKTSCYGSRRAFILMSTAGDIWNKYGWSQQRRIDELDYTPTTRSKTLELIRAEDRARSSIASK